jgi:phosphoglycolate phosphatase
VEALVPSVRAALFDLDGTLVDSLATIADATVEAFGRHGHRVTPQQILPRIGPPMEVVALEVTGASPEEAQAMYKTYQDLYYSEYIQHTPPHDGAHELIEALRTAGVALGIVTNKNEFGGRLFRLDRRARHRRPREAPRRPRAVRARGSRCPSRGRSVRR